MSKVFIEDTSLTAIGDAIRAKGGTTELLSVPDGMVAAIAAIEAGGGGSGEIGTESGLVDGNGYVIYSTKISLASEAGSYVDIDLSAYISDTSTIDSIFGASGAGGTGGALTAYWNRSCSPEGYPTLWSGSNPSLFRFDYSIHPIIFQNIDGGTTLRIYCNAVPTGSVNPLYFNRLLIRYTTEV